MKLACLSCQALVVLFLALHDWVPLGRLSNPAGIHASDSRTRLLLSTVLSTLPFAIALIGTAEAVRGNQLVWAKPWAVVAYLLMLWGILSAWWIPYLFVFESKRAERYQVRFENTHAFLPERNGIRPDTLHVCFHGLTVVTFLLICLTSFR